MQAIHESKTGYKSSKFLLLLQYIQIFGTIHAITTMILVSLTEINHVYHVPIVLYPFINSNEGHSSNTFEYIPGSRV